MFTLSLSASRHSPKKKKKILLVWHKLKKTLSLNCTDNNYHNDTHHSKSSVILSSPSSLSCLISPTTRSTKVYFHFSSLFIFCFIIFHLLLLLSVSFTQPHHTFIQGPFSFLFSFYFFVLLFFIFPFFCQQFSIPISLFIFRQYLNFLTTKSGRWKQTNKKLCWF